ncbi:MAG: stage V sporulation protein G [Phycisphaerae bacterium]|jgi:stage V sporulation protein G|nr:stage V sporulation protein G [Phycisphaerae bacterium]
MEVTEVKVKLVDIKSERLKAFCTITLDGEFVIRDIKVIEGGTGPFVAMPSRKLAVKCPRCSTKNHLRAKFCNECGTKLPESKIPKDNAGRIKLHADIAHPINPDSRERIQSAVLKAYDEEVERSKTPGYVPMHIEDFEEDEFGEHHSHERSNNSGR